MGSIYEGATFLKGKRAMVTGGTSGIGLGICRRLQGLGAHVLANSMNRRKMFCPALKQTRMLIRGQSILSRRIWRIKRPLMVRSKKLRRAMAR